MQALAIIPARGGSKRIPRKNIRAFAGRPIIGYPIQAALRSRLFSEVMVSTDDDEIASVAQQCGAEVPFRRSSEASSDHAIIADVLVEVISRYRAAGREFDFACCLLPTAPLIAPADLATAYNKLLDGGFDCVFPVCKFSYPILRSLSLTNGRVKMNWPENYRKRSQDLPAAYHDSGQFYWFRIDRFCASGSLFSENTGGIEIPESKVQDIDSEEDWRLCEMKYRLLSQEIASE
jgi:N-acylneuraminate cytidylyltransferase